MDFNSSLISFLEKVLGCRAQRRGASAWYIFTCPFCKHPKPKFGVYAERGNHHYKCFVCGTKGPSMDSLAFRLRLSADAQIKLISLAPNTYRNKVQSKKVEVPFPKEYRALADYPKLWGWDKKAADKALSYLMDERGLSRIDILRHQIGICASGEFEKRLIIPSFDQYGAINDFSARRYSPDEGWGSTYLGPRIDRTDVIAFENQINWQLPVTIVEGFLDAIAVRRNVIPLGGKYASHALEVSLAQPLVREIYLVLDNDALTRLHELSRYYRSLGKTVYTVVLPDKDPSKLGFEAVNRLVYEAKPFDDDLDLALSFETRARAPIYGKGHTSVDRFADTLRDDVERWFAPQPKID